MQRARYGAPTKTQTPFVSPRRRRDAFFGRRSRRLLPARTGLLKVVISSPRGDERAGVTLADPEHSGPGSIAGELALIDGAPRSASVIAIRDCELSFISRAEFTECAQQHPEIYRYLVKCWRHACGRPTTGGRHGLSDLRPRLDERSAVSEERKTGLPRRAGQFRVGPFHLLNSRGPNFKSKYDSPTPTHDAAVSTKKSLILAWRPGTQFCATSIAPANVTCAIARNQSRCG